MNQLITFEILPQNLGVATSVLKAAQIPYELVNSHQFMLTGFGYNAAYPTLIRVAVKDQKQTAELLKGL